MGRLERESRRLLAIGFLFAILFHAGLAILVPRSKPIVPATVREKPDRIIHTDIIELPPRFTAPYTAAKPRFTQRAVRPEGVSRSGPALPATPGLPGKRFPSPLEDRPYAFTPEPLQAPEWKADTDSAFTFRGGITPGERAGRIIPREFPLREEALRPEDYEWTSEGQKIGLVEYNPKDKLAIRGIVPIPELWGCFGPRPMSPGMKGLTEGIRTYTDLTLGRWKRYYLSDTSYLGYPFVHIASYEPWAWLKGEAETVGEYLRRGGFIFFEGGADMREFIMDALGPETRFMPIPNDHPVYHCYFDFPEGPPFGFESSEVIESRLEMKGPFLRGIWIGSRLAAVYSNKRYCMNWNRADGGGDQLRLGINLLIYSLRQEGGNAVVRHDPSLEQGIKAKRNIAGLVLTPVQSSE
jgi:hypothetical protein